MPVLSEGVRGAAHRPQEGTQSLLCPLKGGIHIPIRRSPLGRGARNPCPLLDSVGHLSRVKVEPLSRSRIGANLDTSRRRCREQSGKAVKEDERELARIIRCDAHELIEAIKSLESEETINVSRTLIGEVDTGYMVYYLASKKI